MKVSVRTLSEGHGLQPKKVIVVRKYPHIVELVSLKDPKRSVTMTYTELLKQKKDRARKKASGR